MTSKQSFTLTLAIHELVANAVKYGALSQDGGEVEIYWSIDQSGPASRGLQFLWRKLGGRRLQNPIQKGLDLYLSSEGSRLILT